MPACSGQPRNHDAIAFGGAPAGADFQSDRNADRRAHRGQDVRDQRFIAQQGRARRTVAHFLGGAAHVDVDDVGTEIGGAARGVGHHARLAAGNLDHAWRDFAVECEPRAGLVGVPQAFVAGHHLGHRVIGAEATAQGAERFVADTRHGRQDHRINE
jgi:hypothetical protein